MSWVGWFDEELFRVGREEGLLSEEVTWATVQGLEMQRLRSWRGRDRARMENVFATI
jgi:hypothetical protein